ncbi:RNA-dependent RNA polymerase 1 [Hyphodiscus hymeniophilus]|uniref:RNA-dependent RNA polymerase n=1 Tax=Hyphodiscus hymeniophilus TaxID=353542 RepID=A0A9P7AZ53_9HELO|nr:RNA-dependent RNA polymerase 1 [Hyphodiscus hymeniophilus]
MEVFVRNVPPQSTENGFKKFMKPHLSNISIQAVHCSKGRDKSFASLTFLYVADAQRFLAQHGQPSLAPGSRLHQHRLQASRTVVNLFFGNRPIYFQRSNREPDPFHLRVLRKEENERKTKPEATATLAETPSVLPLSFECSSVSCGVWSYANSDLVFAPQVTWKTNAIAKFGQRSMVLNMGANQRVEFRYPGVEGITTEDGALIISMVEPPRFFDIITDTLADLMASFGFSGRTQVPRGRSGPNRHRTSFLDEDHRAVVGNCIIYRFGLVKDNMPADQERMKTLQNARGLPSIVHRYTRIVSWPEPYALGLRRLRNILSSANSEIPFVVKFQVQKLVQNNYLTPSIVIELIPTVKDTLERSGVDVCVSALRKLFPSIPYPAPGVESSRFQLDTLVDTLTRNEESCKGDGPSLQATQRTDNVANIHRVKVTPTHTFLYGPEQETTNRVLRKYADHHEYFLRVQFCDEDGTPVRFDNRVSHHRIYRDRFEAILLNGIQIADRKYDFLGFSHSSLRAQTCWFVAPFFHDGGLIWDRMIIRQLGEFASIRSPAKCAARIGQTFSDTPITVKIDPNIVRYETDVERNGRVFSDGVGTMSTSLMHKMWGRLTKASHAKPTCFQIRYAGAKGMISLDSRLKGDALVLRPSMVKFEGTNKTDIEICESAYRPLMAYLNRQFIKILEDMGVPDDFFLNLQQEEINRLRMITDSPINASSFLKRQSIGEAIHLPWLIIKLASMKLDFRLDGFLSSVLEITILMELRQLKHRTRIPVEKGYCLHGIMDETGTLEEGQVYCTARVDGVNRPVIGKRLVISRAPALHPGDVQFVEGIDVPRESPLAQLSNCIVFSQKGPRDLPSQLSGGDLDGDRYHIIWDEACQPLRNFLPADYPRQTPIDIGRPVDRRDMTDFFITFMETDQLGRIAVLHRILSDQRSTGTLDKDCITLAGMHSTAVDFSKTGIPVDMTQMPRYNPWRPDFEAPGPYVTIEKNDGIDFEAPRDVDEIGDDDDDFTPYSYYESDKILGKLYRDIDERKIFEEIKQHAAMNPASSATVIHAIWAQVQRATRLIQWEHKKEWARDLRNDYEECVWNIMTQYSEHPLRPLSELEAFVGNILGRTGAQSHRQRELSTSLKEKFDTDSAFFVNCIVKDGDEYSDESLERSLACLSVSLEEREGVRRGEQLLSFRYVAAAVCLREVERMIIV